MLSVDFPGKKHVRNTLQSVEWKETPVKVSPTIKAYIYVRTIYRMSTLLRYYELPNKHDICNGNYSFELMEALFWTSCNPKMSTKTLNIGSVFLLLHFA